MKSVLFVILLAAALLTGCVSVPMHQQTSYFTIEGKDDVTKDELINWAEKLNKKLGLDFWRINPKDPEYFVIYDDGAIPTTRDLDSRVPVFMRVYYAQDPTRLAITYTNYSITRKKGMNIPALKEALEFILREAREIGTFQLSDWDGEEYNHVDTDYF